MSLQQYFPFSPDYSSWEDWNGNLISWYSEEPLPSLPEVEWQTVAKVVAQTATFANYPVPDPEGFGSWQDWANNFTQIINGPTQ
jgi:hypothetical protein